MCVCLYYEPRAQYFGWTGWLKIFLFLLSYAGFVGSMKLYPAFFMDTRALNPALKGWYDKHFTY